MYSNRIPNYRTSTGTVTSMVFTRFEYIMLHIPLILLQMLLVLLIHGYRVNWITPLVLQFGDTVMEQK